MDALPLPEKQSSSQPPSVTITTSLVLCALQSLVPLMELAILALCACVDAACTAPGASTKLATRIRPSAAVARTDRRAARENVGTNPNGCRKIFIVNVSPLSVCVRITSTYPGLTRCVDQPRHRLRGGTLFALRRIDNPSLHAGSVFQKIRHWPGRQ